MKKLLILILLLPNLCFGAMSFLQSPDPGGNCGATTCTSAFLSNVTAGSLVTVECAQTAGIAMNTPTDTLTNTYTLATTTLDTLDGNGQLGAWYILSSAGGADTVTCNAASSANIRITIQESAWGGATGTFDKKSTSNSGGSSGSMVVPSLTPSADGEAIIAAYRNPNGVTFTGGSNMTLRAVAPAAASSREGSETWYQTTATATTCPMTQSVSQSYTGLCITFKPVAAAVVNSAPKILVPQGTLILNQGSLSTP